MSAPKSVVKMNKKGIQYTSSVEVCQYYMFELTRAALRDVGKFVTRKFREAYYQHFQKDTGNAGKATKYSVVSKKDTKYPRVEIGLKTGPVEGFYAYFQELGTSKTPKLGLLGEAVNSNVPEIVKIESQYLSGLESESAALSLIESENEYEGDADGE